MHDWLSHRTGATPEATALRVAGGPATTYGTLDDRVEELAGHLSGLGVGVGTHLGVCLPTRPAFVELVHAAMRVGAVLVPLQARSTARELADRAGRADCSLLCCGSATESTALEAAHVAADDGVDLPVATVDDPRKGATAVRGTAPETFDVPAWSPTRRLCLLFTSGTTGDPKAVDLRMGNVLASAAASAFRLGLDPGDRWFDPLSMAHMGGLAPVYRSVCYGTEVALAGPDASPDGTDDASGDGHGGHSVGGFDPAATLAAMHEVGATCTSLVPTMLSRLLDAGELPESLRFVLLGGAPASDDLLERCVERDVPVAPTYGMTETASQIATARPSEARAHLGTVGNPLFTTDVTVVDEGTPVETGEQGELVVSGPTVTPGYYRDPEATEQAPDTATRRVGSGCSTGSTTGSTPAARRSTRGRSSRPSGRSRESRTRRSSACRTPSSGSGSPRWSFPPTGRSIRPRWRPTIASAWPGSNSPEPSVSRPNSRGPRPERSTGRPSVSVSGPRARTPPSSSWAAARTGRTSDPAWRARPGRALFIYRRVTADMTILSFDEEGADVVYEGTEFRLEATLIEEAIQKDYPDVTDHEVLQIVEEDPALSGEPRRVKDILN